MLMIVLCHIIKFYTFIPGSQIYGQFLNVGVEVFFAMSGYLYGRKNISDFKGWIKKRIQRIWVPIAILVLVDYFILVSIFGETIPVTTLMVYLLNLQGLLFVSSDFFGKFFSAIPNLGPLWFTTIIMICYLLLPLFQRFRDKCTKRANKKTIYIVCIISLFCVSLLIQAMTHTTTFYIFVFLSGYLLADLKIENTDYSRTKVVSLVVTISALILTRVVLRRFIDGTALYSLLVSIEHSIMGISLLCLGIELGKKFKKLFERIGHSAVVYLLDGASFYIYLVHGIFCAGITSIYGKVNLVLASIIFIAATLICAKILWVLTDLINGRINQN